MLTKKARTYLYFYGKLSGNPDRNGHHAEVNGGITLIHALLHVRDRLAHIREFTER